MNPDRYEIVRLTNHLRKLQQMTAELTALVDECIGEEHCPRLSGKLWAKVKFLEIELQVALS